MDPLIIDRTPKGSAILAYGTARGPGWNWKLLAVVAGSLAFVLCIAGITWFLTASVDVPSGRLLAVTIQPRGVAKKLDPALRRDLFAPWRTAIESRSRFPAVLGMSLGSDGQLHPFAIVARSATVMEVGLTAATDGAFVLLTLRDDEGIAKERVPVRHAFRDAVSLKKAEAAFTLRMDMLAQFALPTDSMEASAEELRGRWSGRIGTLNVTTDGQRADGAVAGPLFAVLGSGAEAQPAVTGLLSQGFDVRGLSDAPQAIAMDPADGGSVALYWDKAPSREDSGILLAVQNRGRDRVLALPDLTEITEILPGMAPTTSVHGSTMLFLGDGLASSTYDFIRASQTCPGTVRFSYEGAALQQTLTGFSIPDSWKAVLRSIRLTETEGKTKICLE